MLTIKTFAFNPIQTNTFIVHDETKECVIIDAAFYYKEEEEEFNAYILHEKLKPVRMINTHGHFDHILGIVPASKRYEIQAEVNPEDAELVKNAESHSVMFGVKRNEWPVITKFLNEEDQIIFGNTFFTVIHTPGHTPGCICFYHPQEKVIFTGDTLFAGSVGRTDLPGGNYDSLMNSIKNKLLVLDDSVRVFCGHGSATTIGFEKTHNPFLTD